MFCDPRGVTISYGSAMLNCCERSIARNPKDQKRVVTHVWSVHSSRNCNAGISLLT